MQKLLQNIFDLTKKQFAIIAIVGAFILYGNTLGHDYALDDAIVITQNEFTKQGFKGIPDILKYDSFTGFFGKEKQLVDGGRYRPFSLITFAIEYQLLGQSPFFSHLINILLYGFISFIIYSLIIKLFKLKFEENATKLLAFFASILFLIHPIHTEVVANIKGRDELFSLLFSLLAFHASIKYTNSKKLNYLLLSFIYIFIGLMSKENTIAFLTIIPLGIWFFMNANSKTLLKVTLPLVLGALVFLIIRFNVLDGFQNRVASELMNNPFLGTSQTQKYATIMYTWVIYLKLLIFPHPLTYDYYPYQIPIVNFSNIASLFSLLLILVFLIITVVGIKNKNLPSFAVFGFAATFSMVSNILFPIGTFMNERFVFMPSLFWCLAISYFLMLAFQSHKKHTIILATISIVYFIGFYPIKTIARNTAWKNDLILFTTDVKVSKNSAKSNCSAGGKLWEEGKLTQNEAKKNKLFIDSEKYLRRSLQIHPNYVDAWLLLGNVLYDAKNDIEGSVNCYIEVAKRQPFNKNAWNNADIVLQKSTDRQLQYDKYLQLYGLDSNRYTLNYRLGVIEGRYRNNLQKSIFYLSRANQIEPNKVETLKDLGTAYGISGMSQKAYETSKKALELDKNDPQIYINTGIAASQLGLTKEAEQYFSKAKSLNENKK